MAWRYHDGELRFEHGYQRNRKPFDMGTVWLAEGPRYDTPLHSPEQDSDRRYHRSALYWDHQLTERLALAASAAYAEVTREDLLIGFAPPEVPAASPLTGAAYEITDDYSQVDGRVQLDYQAPFEGGEQRWIAGADFQRREIDMARTSYGGYELDPRAPDFSEISLSALDSVDSSETEKERRRGLYLAHRTELDGALRWSAGLRHNSFEIDRSRALYAMERQRVAEDDDLSWQGSVELPVSDHSRLALGMTTAFRPNEGRDRHGDFLPARESRMLEATWRLRPRSGHQLALTGYEQEEQHLPVVDEAHSPDGWVADEEQVYKAVDRVEVTGGEVRYRLQEAAWRLDAHATLQRSRSYEGEEHQGHHFVGVPRRLAGLSLQHDLGAYAGLPLQLWYSGEYVGGWYLDEANEYRTEAYTLHHVGATYRWDEESRLELRVRNLTDERYLAAASAPAIQGERRRIRLGLVRAF
ncbi:MAG: TonB-dependent receptor domain-containing protein [Halorhodospira sp.]